MMEWVIPVQQMEVERIENLKKIISEEPEIHGLEYNRKENRLIFYVSRREFQVQLEEILSDIKTENMKFTVYSGKSSNGNVYYSR
jgi:ribosomal protein S1